MSEYPMLDYVAEIVIAESKEVPTIDGEKILADIVITLMYRYDQIVP